ncbi:MAG TPA: hypothetical protein VH877_20555 [Polyangia bacterium]|nr:hypothetical protein [Polyangia bacterium]
MAGDTPGNDAQPDLGSGPRSVDLMGLTDDEGARLLAQMKVGGSEEVRRDVSRRLAGHPLALRVFASALALEGQDDPAPLCRDLFGEEAPREDDPLELKLKRLLARYQEKLPERQTLLLGLVALFPEPVDVGTVCRMARELPVVRKPLGRVGDKTIAQALRRLCDSHLLVREAGPAGEERYRCPPMLRDHFRAALLERSRKITVAAAEMLAGLPAAERPESAREIEPVLTAIELLLEASDFVKADELYRWRLENGRLLKRLPALHEGLRCVLRFVGTARQRAQCEHQLSTRKLGFYLNEAALFTLLGGETRGALPFYQASLAVYRGAGDKKNLSIGLRNLSDLCRALGQLGEAKAASREALSLAEEMDDAAEQEKSWASLGTVLVTAGRVSEAASAFDQANALSVAHDPDGDELYSTGGIAWADLLLRLGFWSQARRLTEANLKICQRHGWSNDVGRCHWILGRLDMAEGQLASAGAHLATAESTLRRGQVLMALPAVLLAAAELHVAQGAFDAALAKAEEALQIATPRELRLHQADALLTRGRIFLARAQALPGDAATAQRDVERVQEDGEAGLALAKGCGYVWAERDALWLLSETMKALSDPARSRTLAEEFRVLERRLLPVDLLPDPPHLDHGRNDRRS